MWKRAVLWIHDNPVVVHTAAQGPLTRSQLAAMDSVYTFEGRQLLKVR